ncbi:unnamed protein product [Pocillopora meandrina]|uniref:G-protein coupled receptors family 1 profile domain-containing protein n=1 Tax=Pocillopora meandrina TaxID=46732 RepID=A0AAU9WRY2_9CNID|nr:unnamed protein product [Pocillopora meandrina]
MLVTFERFIAIKITSHYPNSVTDKKVTIALIAVWIIAFVCRMFEALEIYLIFYSKASLVAILRIKVQQLPQEEVERFTKEDEAIMTTVFAIGAVIFGLPQVSLCLIILATGHCSFCPINGPIMLNSYVNPLIYRWRQKEMRKHVLTPFSFANAITMTSIDGDTVIFPPNVNCIISISINSIACPFTVLLNVLVIIVVKKRPRLRTNNKILLACLVVTDALTGLFGQPLYVLWRIFLIFGLSSS